MINVRKGNITILYNILSFRNIFQLDIFKINFKTVFIRTGIN